MGDLIQQELEHRRNLWQTLLNGGGPQLVEPGFLRELGIYGGAQGVWIHKTRTGYLTEEGTGVTVGLLHTGTSYADDLFDDGVKYHYPKTRRGSGRDTAEIDATKVAGELGLPVFVITYPTPSSSRRTVHFGWVEGWDDDSEMFLITFAEQPPNELLTKDIDDDLPFALVESRKATRTSTATTRTGQQRFQFRVLQRYGAKCAVCGINLLGVLDAAHIRPKEKSGSDDPRNGLILCASHHRALDAGLFGIEPDTVKIHFKPNGPNGADLRIRHSSLRHLRQQPHRDALEWRWRSWRAGD